MNTRIAAIVSSWLAPIRPSLAATAWISWAANRGQSQTVAATEASAATIISPMKSPLVSPMPSAPGRRGLLQRATEPVEHAGHPPRSCDQSALADVHGRACLRRERARPAGAGEQHRDRLHGLVAQQP